MGAWVVGDKDGLVKKFGFAPIFELGEADVLDMMDLLRSSSPFTTHTTQI